MQNVTHLLRARRFAPLFATQFLGAFNDSLFKQGVVLFVTYQLFSDAAREAQFNAIAQGLFILPFFLFSALAGQLADDHDKSRLIRIIKMAEILIMIVGGAGLMFESIPLMLLAVLGGATGLLVAHWGGAALRAGLLDKSEAPAGLRDPRTVLFAAGAAIIVGVITGLAPVLQAGRANLTGDLKSGSREGTYHRSKARIGLLVLQATLSVVLLVGAGLFVRSLRNVKNTRLGYDVEPVMLVNLNMRGVKLDSVATIELRQRVAAERTVDLLREEAVAHLDERRGNRIDDRRLREQHLERVRIGTQRLTDRLADFPVGLRAVDRHEIVRRTFER